MDYRGYKIIAEVNVTQVWGFYEDENGSPVLSDCLDAGCADESGIDHFSIEDKDGDQIDGLFPETVELAKQQVDWLVSKKAA